MRTSLYEQNGTLRVHLKHNYDVRLPNFTFSEEPKQTTTNFLFSNSFDKVSVLE